jgi:hypothetical protein
MPMTVTQMRKESHALALYLLLCSDTTGASATSFLQSGGDIDQASTIFYGIDPNVFQAAWSVISPGGGKNDIAAITNFLTAFKPVSKAASGYGYPDDPDACPTPQSISKLLV